MLIVFLILIITILIIIVIVMIITIVTIPNSNNKTFGAFMYRLGFERVLGFSLTRVWGRSSL